MIFHCFLEQLAVICSVDFQKKIIKIVATRCQILRLKCTKFNFETPLGGFKGPTSKGRREGEGKGREVTGGEGK